MFIPSEETKKEIDKAFSKMKTIKIIDLLNKIANGEEVPKRIKYENIDYFWCNQCKIYERTEDDSKDLYNDLDNLNDEVEILEEEKKIPEKLDHLIGYDIQQFDDLKEYVEIATNDLFGKVNKIIDTLNQLSDYLKSKGE